MKALTLWQPWASLCVLPRPCHICNATTCDHLGVPPLPFKTIETRSWAAPKALIGQRIAIHAAKKVTDDGVGWEYEDSCYFYDLTESIQVVTDAPNQPKAERNGLHMYVNGGAPITLPLGAVVGTAVLTDCVPMVDRAGCGDNTHHVCIYPDELTRHTPLPAEGDDRYGMVDTEFDVSDQRPFGDFAPGRWAWLLADVVRFDEPIPARGGQRIWNWRPSDVET